MRLCPPPHEGKCRRATSARRVSVFIVGTPPIGHRRRDSDFVQESLRLHRWDAGKRPQPKRLRLYHQSAAKRTSAKGVFVFFIGTAPSGLRRRDSDFITEVPPSQPRQKDSPSSSSGCRQAASAKETLTSSSRCRQADLSQGSLCPHCRDAAKRPPPKRLQLHHQGCHQATSVKERLCVDRWAWDATKRPPQGNRICIAKIPTRVPWQVRPRLRSSPWPNSRK